MKSASCRNMWRFFHAMPKKMVHVYHPNPNNRLFERFSPQLTEIIQHPFNQSMYEGRLPQASFLLFLDLDASIYLPRYANAVHRLSLQFQTSKELLCADQLTQLHERVCRYIERIYALYPILQKQRDPTPVNQHLQYPAFDAFSSHLIQSGSNAVLLARILACLWLYLQMGRHFDLSLCVPENPFLPWLESYQRPGFVESTIELLDTLSTLIDQGHDELEKERIMQAFKTSLDHELAILNCIYPHKYVEGLIKNKVKSIEAGDCHKAQGPEP